MRNELDWKNDVICYSHWGTTIEKGSGSETATGRFIDVQPVNNKLNQYSDAVELIHAWIIDVFSDYLGENSLKSKVVNYGRRYLIESPDQIWEKYLSSKEKNAPYQTLNLLLEQYYESEFQHNELMRDYYHKIIKLEPFVHNMIQEVLAMPIQEVEKQSKIYFNDWLETVMISRVVETDISTLRQELIQFSNNKLEANGENQESGNGE